MNQYIPVPAARAAQHEEEIRPERYVIEPDWENMHLQREPADEGVQQKRFFMGPKWMDQYLQPTHPLLPESAQSVDEGIQPGRYVTEPDRVNMYLSPVQAPLPELIQPVGKEARHYKRLDWWFDGHWSVVESKD